MDGLTLGEMEEPTCSGGKEFVLKELERIVAERI
jgi:hypothetical protein